MSNHIWKGIPGFKGECSCCGDMDESKSEMGSKKIKEEATNPKDAVGALKPNFSYLPPAGSFHTSLAMMNGAVKYNPYNWRDPNNKPGYMTYLAAMKRHIDLFIDGEQVAKDSLVHHLGHVAAGAMILLDAIECGNAIDDRPIPGQLSRLFDEYLERIKNADKT